MWRACPRGLRSKLTARHGNDRSAIQQNPIPDGRLRGFQLYFRTRLLEPNVSSSAGMLLEVGSVWRRERNLYAGHKETHRAKDELIQEPCYCTSDSSKAMTVSINCPYKWNDGLTVTDQQLNGRMRTGKTFLRFSRLNLLGLMLATKRRTRRRA
jgi:hypothetical protein